MSETELDAYRESLKDIIHIDGEFETTSDIAPVVQSSRAREPDLSLGRPYPLMEGG